MIDQVASAVQVAQNAVDRLNKAIFFPLMLLMTSVAAVVFLWGAFQFIAGAGDETARTKGKRHMIYGILGMFVMLSAYTILKIAAGTFGISA